MLGEKRRVCDQQGTVAFEHLGIHQDETSWEICFRDKRYLVPVQDVKPLPFDNLTAERLAEYIWGEVARELRKRRAGNLKTLMVGVEEAPGQAAYFTRSF